MKYAVIAPELVSNSAGCYSLYQLNRHLREMGEQSRIVVPGKNDPPTDDEIVIYTDYHVGNPYKAKNVVRFLLMYAGYFGKDKDFPESEMMWYYTPEFVLKGRSPENLLQMPVVKEERFPFKGPEGRSGSCYLAFKYRDILKNQVVGLPEGCEEITRGCDIAEMFSRVKTLYTFDNSTINVEAALAGVEIVWCFNPTFKYAMKYGDYWSWSDVRASYTEQNRRYFEQQLPSFISKTQARFTPPLESPELARWRSVFNEHNKRQAGQNEPLWSEESFENIMKKPIGV